MRVVFVFVAIAIPFASAGVGRVTPEVEAQALRLWNEFCSGGEGGENGDLHVYCKLSQDTVTERVPTTVTVTPKPVSGNHVIFVRPPTKHTDHDIVVKGNGKAGQKTVVYVLPSKATNKFNVKDETEIRGSTEKPVVFFLKKDHGSSRGKREEELDSQEQFDDTIPEASENVRYIIRPRQQ